MKGLVAVFGLGGDHEDSLAYYVLHPPGCRGGAHHGTSDLRGNAAGADKCGTGYLGADGAHARFPRHNSSDDLSTSTGSSDASPRLRAKLNITKAQENLWINVTEVMRDNANTMDTLRTARSTRAQTMTAVDDLTSYGEIVDAHAAGLRTFIPAFTALYNSMSDSQKRNADTIFHGPDMASKHTPLKTN